jgi:hypothetical protein
VRDRLVRQVEEKRNPGTSATVAIRKVPADSFGVYGAHLVHAEPTLGAGIADGHNAVEMVMRRAGIPRPTRAEAAQTGARDTDRGRFGQPQVRQPIGRSTQLRDLAAARAVIVHAPPGTRLVSPGLAAGRWRRRRRYTG